LIAPFGAFLYLSNVEAFSTPAFVYDLALEKAALERVLLDTVFFLAMSTFALL